MKETNSKFNSKQFLGNHFFIIATLIFLLSNHTLLSQNRLYLTELRINNSEVYNLDMSPIQMPDFISVGDIVSISGYVVDGNGTYLSGQTVGISDGLGLQSTIEVTKFAGLFNYQTTVNFDIKGGRCIKIEYLEDEYILAFSMENQVQNQLLSTSFLDEHRNLMNSYFSFEIQDISAQNDNNEILYTAPQYVSSVYSINGPEDVTQSNYYQVLQQYNMHQTDPWYDKPGVLNKALDFQAENNLGDERVFNHIGPGRLAVYVGAGVFCAATVGAGCVILVSMVTSDVLTAATKTIMIEAGAPDEYIETVNDAAFLTGILRADGILSAALEVGAYAADKEYFEWQQRRDLGAINAAYIENVGLLRNEEVIKTSSGFELRFEYRDEYGNYIPYSLDIELGKAFLTAGVVSPQIGSPEDEFEFIVYFTDELGEMPLVVKAIVGTNEYDLNYSSGDINNGALFTATETFLEGNHSYYFEAETSSGKIIRFPESGTLNFSVETPAEGHDIEIRTTDLPSSVKPGRSFDITISLRNIGTGNYTETDFPIEFKLYAPNGNEIDSETVSVTSILPSYNKSISASLSTSNIEGFYTIDVQALNSLDENRSNNILNPKIYVGDDIDSEEYRTQFYTINQGETKTINGQEIYCWGANSNEAYFKINGGALKDYEKGRLTGVVSDQYAISFITISSDEAWFYFGPTSNELSVTPNPIVGYQDESRNFTVTAPSNQTLSSSFSYVVGEGYNDGELIDSWMRSEGSVGSNGEEFSINMPSDQSGDYEGWISFSSGNYKYFKVIKASVLDDAKDLVVDILQPANNSEYEKGNIVNANAQISNSSNSAEAINFLWKLLDEQGVAIQQVPSSGTIPSNGSIAPSTAFNTSNLEEGVFQISLEILNFSDDNPNNNSAIVNINVVVPKTVTANFIASNTSGTTPFAVEFSDLSTTENTTITSWEWDFNGDGVVDDTRQNPSYTFNISGIYDVQLTVSDGTISDPQLKEGFITVVDIDVDFEANIIEGINPLTVEFSDLTTSDYPITSWLWNFGDGTTSTGQNPEHIFEYPGNYTVSLIASNNYGDNIETKNDYIKVSEVKYIEVTPTSLSFQAGVESKDITITSNTDWNISYFQGNWFAISQTNGTGDATVTVTSKMNTGGDTESTQLLVFGEGISNPVPVNLSQRTPPLSVSPSEQEIECELGSIGEIRITTDDVNWYAYTNSVWLDLSASSGLGSATIEATANSENTTGDDRTAIVNVSVAGIPFKFVKITQKACVTEESHFKPNWEVPGLDHMNIYILTAQLDGFDLSVGDEIGIFDSDNCVGFGILTEVLTGSNYLECRTSLDDPTTTEIDGFVAGNAITYRIWKSDIETEYSNVSSTYDLGSGVFSSNGSATVHLNAVTSIEQSIDLNSNWNILSYAVEPEATSMMDIVSPLINEAVLYKVQDERGNALENLGVPIGWINNIGDMHNTEGYKIKVTSAYTHKITGKPIELPFTINLAQNWNIMGYPVMRAQSAINVFQPLIDTGTLIKVQDEEGNAIENLGIPIGWIDNIINLEPGEGYKVKVSQEASIILNDQVSASTIKSASIRKPVHFNTAFLGYGLDHMNVYLSKPTADGISLQKGDEVAVFDGDVCVGVGVINKDSQALVGINVSYDDPTTDFKDGFTEGNPFILKMWNKETDQEGGLQHLSVVNGFKREFERFETTMLNVDFTPISKTYLGDAYPNPSKDQTTIPFSLAQDSRVTLEIYDITGSKIKTLIHAYFVAGEHSIVWDNVAKDGSKIGMGMYVYKFTSSSGTVQSKRLVVE